MQANLDRGMTRQRKGKGNAETSETVYDDPSFCYFFVCLVVFFGWFKLINKINQKKQISYTITLLHSIIVSLLIYWTVKD